MAREVAIRGLWIFVNSVRCAHACRYCSVGRKTHAGISFDCFAKTVERFEAWSRASGPTGFDIGYGIGHCYEYEASTLGALFALRDRFAARPTDRSVSLGGLRLRDDRAMRAWLEERRDLAGIDRVHASLAGCDTVHDRWNGRRGDFAFQLGALRQAADLGLRLTERIFVTKSTLPALDELGAALDGLPSDSDRQYSLFFYRGLATRHENERLCEADRKMLAAPIRAEADAHWHSEREWLDRARTENDGPDAIHLKLILADDNIDWVATASCDEIIGKLTDRAHAAYAALPSRQELREQWADETGTLLYGTKADVESRCLDRYLAHHPVTFERQLTHLWRDF